MHILSGSLRGRALPKPKGGHHIRPTGARTRAAIFNLLAHNPALRAHGFELKDAVAADLCCGTGALGFEAISLGAASVTFVDQHRPTLALIRETAEKFRIAEQVRTLGASVSALPKPPLEHTLALLDPPYAAGLILPALEELHVKNWLAMKAVIVAETGDKHPPTLPTPYRLVEARNYGMAQILLIIYEK